MRGFWVSTISLPHRIGGVHLCLGQQDNHRSSHHAALCISNQPMSQIFIREHSSDLGTTQHYEIGQRAVYTYLTCQLTCSPSSPRVLVVLSIVHAVLDDTSLFLSVSHVCGTSPLATPSLILRTRLLSNPHAYCLLSTRKSTKQETEP